MNVIEAIKKRYAAKLFTGEKLPEEDILKLKDAVRFAPSSFNLQPWKIKIVKDKNLLNKLQQASYDQKQVGSASHLFVFCSISDFSEKKKKVIDKMEEKGIPKKKVNSFASVVDSFLSSNSKEEFIKISKNESFLAAENLMLAATSLGYASCPIGGFDKERFKEILKLPSNFEPILIVPVGYAADEPRIKIRLNKEDIFF